MGKLIARDLRKAGLGNWLGTTGERNVQGEEVHQLDQRANDHFLEVFEDQDRVSVVVSEEMEKPFLVKKADSKGKYVLFIDPLDGSSNVDVNAPLGSIFSFHRLPQQGYPKEENDLLRPGREQMAAGYLIRPQCRIGVHLRKRRLPILSGSGIRGIYFGCRPTQDSGSWKTVQRQ